MLTQKFLEFVRRSEHLILLAPSAPRIAGVRTLVRDGRAFEYAFRFVSLSPWEGNHILDSPRRLAMSKEVRGAH